MKLQGIISITLLLFVNVFYAQNSFTSIETSDGIHYITPNIDYPIFGTYFFEGGEPIVELNANGTGIYQLHEQPKKEILRNLGRRRGSKSDPKMDSHLRACTNSR